MSSFQNNSHNYTNYFYSHNISGCSHSLYSILDDCFQGENTIEDLQGSREIGINPFDKVGGGK